MCRGVSESLIGNPAQWRRIYPDLPGHGQTPVPASVRNHDDVLDMLSEFIDAVSPGERFAVLGWSWGGYLALGIAHHRVRQLDGVVLAIPALTWARDRIVPPHHVVRRDAAFVRALRPEERWLEREVTAQSVGLLSAARETWLTQVTPQDPEIVRLLSGTPLSFDPRDLPEPFPAPALILAGRQDHVVGYQEQVEMLERFPRATLAVLDSAGHCLIYEQPAVAAALIQDWLRRAEDYEGPDRPARPSGTPLGRHVSLLD